MTRAWPLTRKLLLGSNDSSLGATLATGRIGISVLAILTVALHTLDLATGLRMMLVYGTSLEQNPLARLIMNTTGPLGLVEAKLGVVLAGVLMFMRTARAGRPRLARNCLLMACCLGLLGFASNLVG
jgi:uncharacterized membrane protein